MTANKQSTQAAQYRRDFWRMAAQSMPYQGFLIITVKLGLQPTTTWLNWYKQHDLSRTALRSYSNQAVHDYEALTRNVKLWHGSGRYQHDADVIKDIFILVLKNGSLNPIKDDYALLLGGDPTTSISTTPLRMVARPYADMHGKGKFEPNRYGSSIFWISYFYGRLFAKTFTAHGLTMIRNRKAFSAATKNESGERLWGKKVHKQAEYVWDVFSSGSDIQQNYPILFGIKRIGTIAPLPPAFSAAETRVSSPIILDDLNHIEVPEEKIDEINALLRKFNVSIPVVPIELGEFVASHQPFNILVGITKHQKTPRRAFFY